MQRSDRGIFAAAGHNINASSPFTAQRVRQQGDTQNALGQATADVTSQILGGNYQAERGRQAAAQGQYAGLGAQQYGNERAMQMGATGQAAQQAQARLQNAMQGLQASALPRMIQDMGIERGIQEFQRRMGVMQNSLGMAGQLSQPTVGSFGKSHGQNWSKDVNFSLA